MLLSDFTQDVAFNRKLQYPVITNDFLMLLEGSPDLRPTPTTWLTLDIFCVWSGTCWSQTCRPPWPLKSCVRRWERCAALPGSSPSHSSGSMMKVRVPLCKILLCARSSLLLPFSFFLFFYMIAKFIAPLWQSCWFPTLLASPEILSATSRCSSHSTNLLPWPTIPAKQS